MDSDIVMELQQEWRTLAERIDPRVWFVWAFIQLYLVVSVNVIAVFFVIILLQFLVTVRELSFKVVVNLMGGLLIPSIFLLGLNVFLFHLNLGTSFLLIGKFWTLMFILSWFYAKVDPDDFISVLESLRVPSMLAWQFGMAYRQVPFMFRKAREIHDVLISRGIELDRGKLRALRFFPSMLIPLLIQVQEDAIKLSEAMISRGWYPGIQLERVFPLKMTKKDFVMMACMVGYLGLMMIMTSGLFDFDVLGTVSKPIFSSR